MLNRNEFSKVNIDISSSFIIYFNNMVIASKLSKCAIFLFEFIHLFNYSSSLWISFFNSKILFSYIFRISKFRKNIIICKESWRSRVNNRSSEFSKQLNSSINLRLEYMFENQFLNLYFWVYDCNICSLSSISFWSNSSLLMIKSSESLANYYGNISNTYLLNHPILSNYLGTPSQKLSDSSL